MGEAYRTFATTVRAIARLALLLEPALLGIILTKVVHSFVALSTAYLMCEVYSRRSSKTIPKYFKLLVQEEMQRDHSRKHADCIVRSCPERRDNSLDYWPVKPT